MLFKISKDGIECISREFSTVVHKNYRAVAKCFVRGDGFYNVFKRLLKDQFPSLVTKYNKQFALLFNELQKKCENGELTEKALDLRGLIDAISLIKKGIPIRDALDLGITNKIFDSYEKELIRDVIASRFPLKLHNTEVFE